MNRHAYKRMVSGVGYVVVWVEDEQSFPLRNFGDYQSAAFEDIVSWLLDRYEIVAKDKVREAYENIQDNLEQICK